MKYWEIIPQGERSGLLTLSDGKRFVVRADEKLTAFVELESAILQLRKCQSRLR